MTTMSSGLLGFGNFFDTVKRQWRYQDIATNAWRRRFATN